jgi:hypothetical protein
LVQSKRNHYFLSFFTWDGMFRQLLWVLSRKRRDIAFLVLSWKARCHISCTWHNRGDTKF